MSYGYSARSDPAYRGVEGATRQTRRIFEAGQNCRGDEILGERVAPGRATEIRELPGNSRVSRRRSGKRFRKGWAAVLSSDLPRPSGQGARRLQGSRDGGQTVRAELRRMLDEILDSGGQFAQAIVGNIVGLNAALHGK